MVSSAASKPLPVDPVALVAIDLDGTLLCNDGTMSVRSAEAVAEAIAEGVKVLICTGRAPAASAGIYQSLGLDTLIIAHNGALVLNPKTGDVLLHQTLSPALSHAVVEIARRIGPDLSLGVSIGDQLVLEAGADLHVDPTVKRVDHRSDRLERVLAKPVTKVMMSGEPEVLGDIQLALQKCLGDRITFALSHMRLLQVIDGGVSKAVALEKTAAYYGISRDAVMAIGDAPNDRAMMDWAGLAVAVENAWPDILRRAHYTVPSNEEDGVAVALRRYVLAR